MILEELPSNQPGGVNYVAVKQDDSDIELHIV
jgi:hypothetical protein